MPSSVGILLGQLGTPDAPTAPALRRYLRQFLSDPRVVEAPRVLWWLILNLAILPRRPARSAELYRRVWTERGSPLLATTLEQARLLGGALGEAVRVEPGMRYGSPSVGAALDRLLAAGADRILVFPMFPQYASATTGSLSDAVGEHLRKKRVVPAVRFARPYFDHPAYIAALAAVVREELAKLPAAPEKLLASFHGIPRSCVEKGDPYRAHAEATADLLAKEVGLDPSRFELCFQSRFGRAEWLRPYADERLKELASSGARRLAIATPGFVTDCLETIDEIGREARRTFLEAGGEELHRVPCLNAHPSWISAMATIAREELAGWVEVPRLRRES